MAATLCCQGWEGVEQAQGGFGQAWLLGAMAMWPGTLDLGLAGN